MLKIIVLMFSLTVCSKVLAWGDIGHGAIGLIAEKNLTPKAKSLVFSIIGIESLAIAAVWPDQARSDERFSDFAPFHYFEIPKPYTFSTLPAKMRAPSDAHTIISRAPELLNSAQVSREQKMILFRYLVHIVGDVHQPLHIGNGVDRGANLCQVNWTNPGTGILEKTNLHTVWDEKLIENIAFEFKLQHPTEPGTKRWFGAKEFSDMILSEIGDDKQDTDFATVSKNKISDWYDESQNLHSKIYPDRDLVTTSAERTYCKIEDKKTGKVLEGKFNSTKIPTLDNTYIQKSLPIIKKQILKAGYRLAGIINKIAEGSTLKDRTLADDKQLLQEIQLKNQ